MTVRISQNIFRPAVDTKSLMLHARTCDDITAGTLHSHLICEIHLRVIYEI